jgi:hypothetical protein
VDGDAQQPGGELCSALKIAEVLKGTKISLLGNVFCILLVTNDGACGAINPLIMSADQQLE